LLGLVGMVLIAALGGGYWFMNATKQALDAETNCPKSGPSGIHVILFDRSDPISEQQAQRIYENVALLALDFLARIIAMRVDAGPPFSALFTLWLSMIAAVGLASRSLCSRHST